MSVTSLTAAGEDAANYWASRVAATGRPWFQSVDGVISQIFGVMASLVTPSTIGPTLSTLLSGYSMSGLGPLPKASQPKLLRRSRDYLRYDSHHHGKGRHVDGKLAQPGSTSRPAKEITMAYPPSLLCMP